MMGMVDKCTSVRPLKYSDILMVDRKIREFDLDNFAAKRSSIDRSEGPGAHMMLMLKDASKHSFIHQVRERKNGLCSRPYPAASQLFCASHYRKSRGPSAKSFRSLLPIRVPQCCSDFAFYAGSLEPSTPDNIQGVAILGSRTFCSCLTRLDFCLRDYFFSGSPSF